MIELDVHGTQKNHILCIDLYILCCYLSVVKKNNMIFLIFSDIQFSEVKNSLDKSLDCWIHWNYIKLKKKIFFRIVKFFPNSKKFYYSNFFILLFVFIVFYRIFGIYFKENIPKKHIILYCYNKCFCIAWNLFFN